MELLQSCTKPSICTITISLLWAIILSQVPQKFTLPFNTLGPEQNGWYFANYIFKCIFVNEYFEFKWNFSEIYFDRSNWQSMIRDGSMTKPCLPRVAAQPQMTLSFFKPYLSPRWRYCDVMTQLDKTPQWAREDHLRHGNRDNGSDSRGYGVTIRSHWWPLVTLLYLMCW